ncbi:esterase-like activity of phytase family protein [Lyngbya aestuarii BL J]|uniref:Esterase-like activity of phytase family protein n=1 Tax=Lyngbya aestuarii BL J TaxID=1348334 RepID=U7QH24_9CYAN|nr:esterase-like activity of phytase family protein [Lyngbya aestuarii]ERT07193.1 esterase-like activity of phytase family protein [Lyngbya aestuarii BL J]
MNEHNTIKPSSLSGQVRLRKGYQRFFQSVVSLLILLTLLTSCSLPQVSAEDRIFLDFSLDFLGEYSLTQPTQFNNYSIGHLSGITYALPGYNKSTAEGIYFYALADDQKENLARFYTLKFDLTSAAQTSLNQITIENETQLKDQSGQPLSLTTTHPKSLTFSPRNSLFIATENRVEDQSLPLIGEFDLETGKLRNTIPIPPNYIPTIEDGKQQLGISANSGFKSMTIAPDGFSPGGKDPFRLFTSTETSLVQDTDTDGATKLRILHYVIADRSSFLVSENLYPLEADETSPPQLVDIVALNQGGYFLSLERSSNSGQIYQVFTGDSTDTSRIASLRGELRKVQPMRKKLLFEFNPLNISVNSLTSMTLGPRLASGGQSLVLMSEDDNKTPQFLLFSLKQS